MLRSFELLQLASVWTIQQPVQMTLSVRPKFQDFFPKHRYGKIAVIIRTTCIFVLTRSSIRQVSQFKSKRQDTSHHGPDARSLYMEITCSKSATVRTTREHRPNTAHFKKDFSAKFSEFRSHICPSGRCPVFIKPEAHLNRQPINRAP
jgi:hypothetical protein